MGVGWRLEAPAWVEGLRAGEDDGSKGDVGVGNGWLPWGRRRLVGRDLKMLIVTSEGVAEATVDAMAAGREAGSRLAI